MPSVDPTELTDINVIRQDGVKNPASGFPILLMKAAASKDADGDEDGGCGCCPNCAMQPAAKAAAEGEPVTEQATKDGADGSDLPEVRSADDAVRADGLPEAGSEAGSAAVKDGEVETSDAPEASDGEPDVQKDSVAKQIEDAVAEVRKAAEERIEALAAELAVIKATPIPGGPMLTATAAQRDTRVRSDQLAKAAYHKRQASVVQDRDLQRYHREQAAAAEAAAKA